MNLSSFTRYRVCCTIFLLSLSFISHAQNEPYVVRPNVHGCVNVREDHDINSNSIACLTAGTPVTVLSSFPFWREINFGTNQHGWIAKKYIEPASTEPIADTTGMTIPPDALLTFHFIDVGQGDAILIQTHDDNIQGNGIYEGYSILIDCGPSPSDNASALLSYVGSQAHQGANLEALFLTHPHIDHFGGGDAITRFFSVNNYYEPNLKSSTKAYRDYDTIMRGLKTGVPRAKHLHIGKQNFGTLNWGNELKVEVLYSWNNDPQMGSANTKENNASTVLRIQYGEHVFLLMGDAEGKERHGDVATPKYVEKLLLATVPDKLKATVLKIAHHGSETSSTLPFIQAVDPDIVVVQSGRKSFGGTFLPDLSTLQRYCDHNPNVKIYRTDQGDEQAHLSGAATADKDHIIIRSNGHGQLQVQAMQGGQPFNGNFCH